VLHLAASGARMNAKVLFAAFLLALAAAIIYLILSL
jgi:hypothetical protein